MISKDEVERIAKLSRLELSEKETEKMQKDLSAILDYFDLLKKAPKLKMLSLSAKVSGGELRRDEVVSQDDKVIEKIIKSAPDKKDGYIRVKAIL